MHRSTDRTAHTMAFDEPVVDYRLERKIALAADGSTEKDRFDDLACTHGLLKNIYIIGLTFGRY